MSADNRSKRASKDGSEGDLNQSEAGAGLTHPDRAEAESLVARILAREGTALASTTGSDTHADAGALEREERRALRKVSFLANDQEEIRDVEYRQVRLEKVVLVGLWSTGTAEEAQNSLRELAALAETAGAEVLDAVLQRRPNPDPACYLGKGKAKELADMVALCGADTVVVNDDLKPSQRRGLEDIVKVKVVDRTAVILDIFAQHAKSKEGKAQVELAQLQYLLPRLRGWGESMSRQAGGRVAGGEGIGSRGPGETKIELDRRHIRNRMARLRRQLAAMEPVRATKRARRRRGQVPSVAIAGYTNAGKSSLINALTGAEIMVQDALFATLDTTVRRTTTPEGQEYTITDTVGFVRDLPHELVEAFRSTLEEVAEADVIVHVVDAAHPDPVGQVKAVHEVFDTIEGAREIPEIIALNKIDLATPERLALLRSLYPHAVFVSAHTGEGIEELRRAIADRLPDRREYLEVVIPYNRGSLVAAAHENGEVEKEDYLPEGTLLHGYFPPSLAEELCQANSETQ